MRIAATGATSFVGIAAVKELLRRGHEVTAILREGSAKRDLLRIDGEFPEKLTILELDLTKVSELPELIKEPVDIFLHMGWLGAGSDSRKDPEIQKRSAEIAMDAVRAAGKLGCRRFVFTGSQAEYGLHQERITEETECRPKSPYGEQKLYVREHAPALCGELGMDYAHARIFSTYGPGDHPWSLISGCIDKFRADDLMEMTSCTQTWNFLYIDDCGRAIADLCEYEGSLAEHGCVYNLGGPMEETGELKNFVKMLRDAVGSGTAVFGIHPYNAEGIVNLDPDITKMREVLGWEPAVHFEEGIRRILRKHCKCRQ